MQPNSSRSAAYAELAQGQTLARAIVENDPLTPASEWKVAGTSVPKINGRAFVTGEHQYASDIRRPGMMFGKMVRPSAYGATLESLDVSKAKAMPGVTVVHDGDFVGVVAPSEFEATSCRRCHPGQMENHSAAFQRGTFRIPEGTRRAG